SRESRLSRGPESGSPERAASLRVGGRFGGAGRDRRDRRSPHAGIAFQAASRGGGTPPIAAPCPICHQRARSARLVWLEGGTWRKWNRHSASCGDGACSPFNN